MVDITTFEFQKTKSSWALVSVFTLSIFLSATLLFSVQPLFAKLVLPLLGGSSSVWNTAMVFFQGTLLAGYIYAHLISKYLKLSLQILCHLIVLSLGLLFLPLAIASGWTPPEGGAQAYWLIGLFAVSVGMPFFAISANAPLLQRWFSRTSHADADDPYFLYSASNAGSLLSLCLYPILFEPLLRLREQTALWAVGYVILGLVILACGYFTLKNKAPMSQMISKDRVETAAPNLKSRLMWIALAFIPSSLMLGVTSHITNNIASAPFLWIMPLALYLLTFIIVFAKKPIISSTTLSYLLPVAIIAALVLNYFVKMNFFVGIAINLLCYFVIALACHMRLVDTRPSAAHLTEFYIWMSFGGMLGGAFNALLAPLVFSKIYEFVIILSLAVFAHYQFDDKNNADAMGLKKALICIGFVVLTFLGMRLVTLSLGMTIILSGVFLSFGLSSLALKKKTTFLMLMGVVLPLSFVFTSISEKDVLNDRSFFGTLHVVAKKTKHGVLHTFEHGDTIHNYQFQDDSLKKIPLAYYASGTSFDRGLKFARSLSADDEFNVSLIGLGAGAMACYEKPTDNWVYFEIDPAVVKMATNEKYFSYMKECSYEADIRIGDARLKLNDIAEGSQDYIMVDAFSSDSIPAHLLTMEALELYRSRLKPNGLIFFHTSNRVLDISSVVVTLAEHSGLASRYIKIGDFEGNIYEEFSELSYAVIVGTQEQMRQLDQFDENWKRIIPSPDVGLWSDDYSHILGTLKAKYKDNAQIVEGTANNTP